jgi:hypothetical protein
MKQTIYIGILSYILLFQSCEKKERGNSVLENQSEQTLMVTQQIFQHYTTYLREKDNKKMKISAKRLLETFIDLNKIDYKNNPLQLECNFVFDSTCTILDEVYFGSQKFGIAWRVPIDSFINETNRDLNIIQYNELLKNNNR